MSLQQAYDSFRLTYHHDCVPDPKECLCHGSGWVISDLDTAHKCHVHYKGQPHPEDDYAWEDDHEEAMRTDSAYRKRELIRQVGLIHLASKQRRKREEVLEQDIPY